VLSLHDYDQLCGGYMLIKGILYLLGMGLISALILGNNFCTLPLKKFKKFISTFIPKSEFQYLLGKTLLFKLSVLEANIYRGNLGDSWDIPNYKYYSEIIYKLLNNSKKYGINLKKIINELKQKLILDIKLEEKICNEMISGFMQFFFVVLVTWFFIFVSKKMIEIPLSTSLAIIIIFLQLSGLISFYLSTKYLESYYFKSFNNVIKELIIFKSFLEISFPVNQALIVSNISNGEFSNDKSFENLYQFFTESITRLKMSGISPHNDLEIILNTIFDLQEEKMIKFQKQIAVFKFMHLALFFLMAYFIYLYAIFKFFIEQ
jgi:hypothetical protein